MFLDEVAAINWWEVYNCGTVEEAVRMFTEGVNRILDRKDMAPVRTFQQRQKYAPWLSAETKSMMAERDAAVKEARHTSRPEDLAKATKLRNMCTRLLRTEKHRYLKQKLDICEEERDVLGTWKNLKSYLGWGSSCGSPTVLTDPSTGQQTNSPKKMANIQNKFYTDKVRSIRQKLPKIGDPTKKLRDLMNKGPHPRQEGLALQTVSQNTINQIILDLKNS